MYWRKTYSHVTHRSKDNNSGDCAVKYAGANCDSVFIKRRVNESTAQSNYYQCICLSWFELIHSGGAVVNTAEGTYSR